MANCVLVNTMHTSTGEMTLTSNRDKNILKFKYKFTKEYIYN